VPGERGREALALATQIVAHMELQHDAT